MPEIEITEDQRDRLRAVQEALESDVVGKYGHVRASDAVEYLLDRYETDAGEDREGRTGTTDGNAGRVEGGTADEETADEGTTDEGTAPDDTGDDEAETEADGATGADASPTGSDDPLDAMMSLLDEHEDKWDQASSEEARYEVELPDGSTEGVRTKDDVRGLLFRHYR